MLASYVGRRFRAETAVFPGRGAGAKGLGAIDEDWPSLFSLGNDPFGSFAAKLLTQKTITNLDLGVDYHV